MNYGKDEDEEEDKDEDERRRRRDPFGDMFSDIFEFTDINKEFERMQRLAEEMLDRTRDRRRAKNDPFVYGFSIRQGPNGEPKIDEFGNAKDYLQPQKEEKEKSEWTPLADVQDVGETVKVTVDLPGVEKEDIELNVKGDVLIVSVEGKRRYKKNIRLPAKVDPKGSEATYNNGVLEVELSKISEETGESIEIN